MEYAVIIERAGSNWFGHVPDLPGCMATGDTVEEVKANLRTAIRDHILALEEIGEPVPEPAKIAAQVSAA
ncbi:MAG: type II toxin-antitoxin system HicB family antitoxin [Bryobacteraceae bacterium]|jgi:predicted RNase H-like HicB family nuclease|nr:type II toxin-antitoxin system HicB family antitoxin [Solibacteraceae bacterium]MCL4842726.1 type II toxin-antitoxin system HicB family antitoxin [Bryobacteraceae bacterium]MCO5352192.1 type II toxin-antitoxin system HicB family antitoxin [Bryobacteraceae bacterium]